MTTYQKNTNNLDLPQEDLSELAQTLTKKMAKFEADKKAEICERKAHELAMKSFKKWSESEEARFSGLNAKLEATASELEIERSNLVDERLELQLEAVNLAYERANLEITIDFERTKLKSETFVLDLAQKLVNEQIFKQNEVEKIRLKAFEEKLNLLNDELKAERSEFEQKRKDVNRPPNFNSERSRLKSEKDHALILRLTGKVTPDEIKKAYKSLAKVFHPDALSDKSELLRDLASDHFKDILHSYEYFKAKYDIK